MRSVNSCSRGRSTAGRRALVVRWLAGAAVLLAGAVPAGAQQAREELVNEATVRFDAGGGAMVTASARSVVWLSHTARLALAPPQSVVAEPGHRRVFVHRLDNLGSGPDRVGLDVAGPSGWAKELWMDVDGDGRLSPADSGVTAPVALERGAHAALLLVVDVPEDAADLAQAAFTVTAASSVDPAVTAAVEDVISVRRLLPAVTLGKAVDRGMATLGDTLLYTLSYLNTGDGTTVPAAVTDTVPAGLRVLAGSLRLNGAPLTDAVDGDSGQVVRDAGGRDLVRVGVGSVAPAAAGLVTFRATVQGAPTGGTVSNQATLAFGSARVQSPAAQTLVRVPSIRLAKERLGADSVRVGGAVTFRLRYANDSQVTVRNLVLVDSLPAELEYVSAPGSPAVAGRVVTWRLGDLAAGDSGSIEVVTRATAATEGGAMVVNRVSASGANAQSVSATALGFTVHTFRGDELTLAKAAASLEVGPGDVIPYTLTLRNQALVPLAGAVVHDRLPAGTSFRPGTLTGADSARVVGRDLHIFLGGVIAPRGERVVRYALVVTAPEGRVLRNVAWAEAEGGELRSDTASAEVRARRGLGMVNRLLVGKVWLDRNDDGRQQADEPGVEGMEVWSADGEVVATDREGRFSFRDLRPGTHLLRLDALKAPAGWGLPRRGAGEAVVRADGWTLPQVNFRLVPQRVDTVSAPADTVPDPEAPLRSGPAVQAPVPQPADAPLRSGPAPSVAAARPVVPPADTLRARDTLALPTVAPRRSAEERAAEQGRSFVEGPVVRIDNLADGAVAAGERVYVKVRGEAGMPVRLYRGERLVGESVIRPDGVEDFLNVALERGPNVLRVWMRSSWQRERWDSVAVHRSGAPERVEALGQTPTVHAEGRDTALLVVRVLDAWGVPVAGQPALTVQARGALPQGADEDGASGGLQVRVAPDGTLRVPLVGGREVGMASVTFGAGRTLAVVPVRVYPTDRPVIASGIAQVGLGAAAESFGAVTVRGAVARETSLSVSVDTRRGDDEDAFFGRGYDVADEERYPTFGDGSQRRVHSGATQSVSARVERGFDWMELGDVRVSGFAGSDRLGAYRRDLSGMSGRVTAAPGVVLRGFGSFTDQALVQRQVRANGTSGPYRVGGSVRPGTDRVMVEVRDRDNAARLVRQEPLFRFVDYEIDYRTGEILLKRPLPSEDASGNPVFLLASVEMRSGGERRMVGGLRMELDAARWLGAGGADSLGVSVFGVHDGAGSGLTLAERTLMGAEVGVRSGGLQAGIEVVRSESDSSATAAHALLQWTAPGDRFRLGADWMHVGAGFSESMDPRLSAGVQELRLIGEMRVREGSRVALNHERQRFEHFGVDRSNTSLSVTQTLLGREMKAQGGLVSDRVAEGRSSSVATGRLGYRPMNGVDVWMEGAHNLARTPTPGTAAGRPDQVGIGASVGLLRGTRLEGTHRWLWTTGDSAASYQVSAVNVRTEAVAGGQLWGGLERAESNTASHHAVLGWSQRLQAAGGWSFSSMLERRFGLSRASLADPVRALPFAQQEPDRWSAGAGVEWMPAAGQPRFSLRGEMHDGRESRGHRVELAGDAPLSPSLAVLGRSDWLQDRRESGEGERLSRRDRSLVGLAYRPTRVQGLNALAKVEWRRTLNPLALGSGEGLDAGEDTRMIGSADLVWSPREDTELAVRYALRWTLAAANLPGMEGLGARAQYFGLRGERALPEALAPGDRVLRARLDGRMLLVGEAGAARWNLAPSLVARVLPQVELEAGYRLGDLRDPDFGRDGGRGFFATLGFHFTESLLGGASDFWRRRLADER